MMIIIITMIIIMTMMMTIIFVDSKIFVSTVDTDLELIRLNEPTGIRVVLIPNSIFVYLYICMFGIRIILIPNSLFVYLYVLHPCHIDI